MLKKKQCKLPFESVRSGSTARSVPHSSSRDPWAFASLGLRAPFFSETFDRKLPWLEIITDNYLGIDRRHWRELEAFRADSEFVFHGVNLNIGGTDPLDPRYVMELNELFDHFEPAWVSDHICWTAVAGHQSFDLLPLPLNQETLAHLSRRISQIQELTKRPWAFENPSLYIWPETSDMSEGEFFTELSAQTGCAYLLDVNNVYVTSHNLQKDPIQWLSDWPLDRVTQFHLAGGTHQNGLIIDTHNQPVEEIVWGLYKKIIRQTGPRPTIVEWDQDFPEFDVLLHQLNKAQEIINDSRRVSEIVLSEASPT